MKNSGVPEDHYTTRREMLSAVRERSIAEYESVLQLRIREEIQDIIRFKGKARVLDVGCGRGAALYQLGHAFPHNVDLYGIDLYVYGDRLFRDVSLADIEKGVPDLGQFDLVLSIRALQYIRDKFRALLHSSQMLCPGGTAYVNCGSDLLRLNEKVGTMRGASNREEARINAFINDSGARSWLSYPWQRNIRGGDDLDSFARRMEWGKFVLGNTDATADNLPLYTGWTEDSRTQRIYGGTYSYYESHPEHL